MYELQPLLLDTHVWLWLVAGIPELSTDIRHSINRAAAAGGLRIAISLWGIALLASPGRIVLSKSISLWLMEALAEPGPAIEPLSPQIAIESYALPDVFHPDPADRLGDRVAGRQQADRTLPIEAWITRFLERPGIEPTPLGHRAASRAYRLYQPRASRPGGSTF